MQRSYLDESDESSSDDINSIIGRKHGKGKTRKGAALNDSSTSTDDEEPIGKGIKRKYSELNDKNEMDTNVKHNNKKRKLLSITPNISSKSINTNNKQKQSDCDTSDHRDTSDNSDGSDSEFIPDKSEFNNNHNINMQSHSDSESEISILNQNNASSKRRNNRNSISRNSNSRNRNNKANKSKNKAKKNQNVINNKSGVLKPKPKNSTKTIRKRKLNDPTSKAIKNGCSIKPSLTQKWINGQPNQTLKLLTDVTFNIRCLCCNQPYIMGSKGDVDQHCKRKKHKANLKKYNKKLENGNKSKKQGILNRFTDIGYEQNRVLNSFLFSALLSNASAESIMRHHINFTKRFARIENDSKLPETAQNLRKMMKMFGNKVMAWTRESARPFIESDKPYSIMLDEVADNKLDVGVFGPMISFNGKMKPILMDIIYDETAANAAIVIEVFNRVREAWQLCRELFIYAIS